MEIDMLTYHTNDNASNHFSLSSLWYRFGLVIMKFELLGIALFCLKQLFLVDMWFVVYRERENFSFRKQNKKNNIKFMSKLIEKKIPNSFQKKKKHLRWNKYEIYNMISNTIFRTMMQLFSKCYCTRIRIFKRQKWACDMNVNVYKIDRRPKKKQNTKQKNKQNK